MSERCPVCKASKKTQPWLPRCENPWHDLQDDGLLALEAVIVGQLRKCRQENESLRMTQGGMEFTARISELESDLAEAKAALDSIRAERDRLRYQVGVADYPGKSELVARLEQLTKERDAAYDLHDCVIAERDESRAEVERLTKETSRAGCLRRALSSESFEILLPPDATYKVD